MNDAGPRLDLADLYAMYAECICDGALEKWPEFFEEDCLYKVIPRANYDRGLPLAPIFSEGKGALVDRVTTIKTTMYHAPQAVTHNVTGIRIVAREGDLLDTRSMLSVYRTLVDGTTRLYLVGRSFDKVRETARGLKFVERIVVFDSELLAGALVYPV